MRFASLFSFGAVFVCAAFLVACGGGGGGSTPSGGSMTGSHASTGKGPGTTMTIVIHHNAHKKQILAKNAHFTPRSSKRSPKYVSGDAEGLQVTVSGGTGGATQTIYADLTSPSLCTTSGNTETCTVSVPTISTNEQFTVLETDQTPTGSTNGYGTGFASNTNILGTIQQSETVQLGAQNNVALEVNPVAAYVFDCSFAVLFGEFTIPFGAPTSYSAHFGVDDSGVNGNDQARIVVTAGTAVTGSVQPQFADASFDCFDADTVAAPFVDVNNSPAPITLTANNSAVSVAPMINAGTPPPASAYTTIASLPNDGYYWEDCFFMVGVKVASTLSAPQTITMANNLSAISPFTAASPNPYTNTYIYTVVPLSASSYSVSVAANNSTTITGSDFGANFGMDAESAYGPNFFTDEYSGTASPDESCNNSSGTELADVYSSGPINTTTGQQTIEIDAGSTTGTCTFYVVDFFSGVVTSPITVTIN